MSYGDTREEQHVLYHLARPGWYCGAVSRTGLYCSIGAGHTGEHGTLAQVPFDHEWRSWTEDMGCTCDAHPVDPSNPVEALRLLARLPRQESP